MAPATPESRGWTLGLTVLCVLLVPVGLYTTLTWAYSVFTYDSYDQLATAGLGTRLSLYGMALTGVLVFFFGLIFAFIWRRAWIIPVVGAVIILLLAFSAAALMLPRPPEYGG